MLKDMLTISQFLFPLFIFIALILYPLTMRGFIISRRKFKNLDSNAELFFHRVIYQFLFVLSVSIILIMGSEYLQYIGFEDFNIVMWINLGGILTLYPLRMSIEKYRQKIRSAKSNFRDDYILKLRKEEAQFLEISIISFIAGFVMIGIQYSLNDHVSELYLILTIFIIPTLEVVAIFSLLFWLIWHFSRRSEQKKRGLI